MKYKVIIPARGGSKRFPKKNIFPLNEIPLIAHSIIFAQEFDFLTKEDIWVNTDNGEIKAISESYNCNVYSRPLELGADTTDTVEVLKNQVEQMLNNNILFDAVILLQPTNPLRSKELLMETIDTFEKSKRNSLVTYSPLNKKFGKIRNDFFSPENYTVGQRMQDIEPSFFENGLIYITKVSEILNGKIISDDVFPFIFDHPFSNVDIDEPTDILLAEFLIKKYK